MLVRVDQRSTGATRTNCGNRPGVTYHMCRRYEANPQQARSQCSPVHRLDVRGLHPYDARLRYSRTGRISNMAEQSSSKYSSETLED
jgi:hypothetical protein